MRDIYNTSRIIDNSTIPPTTTFSNQVLTQVNDPIPTPIIICCNRAPKWNCGRPRRCCNRCFRCNLCCLFCHRCHRQRNCCHRNFRKNINPVSNNLNNNSLNNFNNFNF
ncbi:MAG TPA: hypothetical protein IAC46_03280 [Candidatus Onthoplasma faecigallinarum]|nr:hypothetical protein [Candidatus Onthoplasma faecigallinarum]